MTVEQQASKNHLDWWLFLVPLLMAGLAILFYVWTFRHLPHNQDPGAWGTFGDYFGGLLNPVVSTLTLFVAIAVWKLQKEAIQLQRSELEETRTILAEQAQTARQERNEQRFFDLLNLHHRTLDSLSYGSHAGRSAIASVLGTWLIEYLFRTGYPRYTLVTNPDGTSSKEYATAPSLYTSTVSTLQDLREDWSSLNQTTPLNPYLRMVHRLLSDAKNLLGHEECFRYIKLFRAQLSDEELKLIALHILLNNEGQALCERVEEFGLLKHLPAGPFRDILEKELLPSVFGRKFAQAHPNTLMEPAAC